MKTETVIKTIPYAKLASLSMEGKIFLDESFQCQDRWARLNAQLYMGSVLEGRAVTPLVLGDIKAILENLRVRFGELNEDYIFFKDLADKGYEYVTIDGNNRTITAKNFVVGKFGLTEKSYNIDNQGVENFKCDKNNKTYETLPADTRVFLDNVAMNVLIVTQATRKGLAELFIAVNMGVSLNPQEKRNAIMCVFGTLVRDLKDVNIKSFEKLFTQNQINRRNPDELIVKVAVICAQGLANVNNVGFDNAYGDNTREVEVFSSHVKPIVTQIMKMVKDYGKGALDINSSISANFLDLAILLKYMKNNSIVVKDPKGFYNWFAETQAARCDSEEILYSGPKGTNVRTYAGLLRTSSKTFLSLRENMLIESLGDIPDGLVTWRDSDRAFDSKKRYSFWKRQNKNCPLTKKYIEPRFIFDGKVTHIDHDIPWSKGGSTSDENGQLVFATANILKSDISSTQEFLEVESL